MPVTTYNIPNLSHFLKAGGHVLPYPFANKPNKVGKVGEYSGVKVADERALEKGDYNKPSLDGVGDGVFYPVKFKWIDNGVRYSLELPKGTIVGIVGRKHVVTTAVAGRDFTVKEIVSAEDYRISIRGFWVQNEAGADIGAWREDIYFALNDFYRFNGSVDVECELMLPFGVGSMVITDLSIPIVEGNPQLLAFEINGVSDEELELELANL